MTNYSVANLSIQQLRQVLTLREQIERLERRLAMIFGGAAPAKAKALGRRRLQTTVAETTAPAAPRRKRGQISAAGRARIAAAQKARWAKTRAQKAAPAPAKRKKSQLSAEGRARISAAQKARWAKTKAAKGSKAG